LQVSSPTRSPTTTSFLRPRASPEPPATDHLIDLAAVHRLLDAHREGPVDHSQRVWTLLVFLI
jgi:hypothetical protein